MLNSVTLVGRLTRDPEVKINKKTKKSRCFITLAVGRTYKNAEGNYDADFIDITVWDQLADNLGEYCHKGDIIGVEGRIETSSYDENGEMKKSTVVIAKKISFLSSKKEDE
ncbi:MAG: single-stranded DNA-binding protein [Bacilli bacterium]|nr:single-stranded DNA-binding protein [Bacilli bacterium]